jgi:hypothetical protein
MSLTMRLLLLDVRFMFSALSVKATLPSLAVVFTVEAELDRLILPDADTAIN